MILQLFIISNLLFCVSMILFGICNGLNKERKAAEEPEIVRELIVTNPTLNYILKEYGFNVRPLT